MDNEPIDIDAIIKNREGDSDTDGDTGNDTGSDATDDLDGNDDDTSSDDSDSDSDGDSDNDSDNDSDDSDNSDDDSDSDDSDDDSDDGSSDDDDSDDDDSDGNSGDSQEDELDSDNLQVTIDGEDISVNDLSEKYTQTKADLATANADLAAINENEFLKGFNEFVLKGGDPEEYLRKTTVDYTKKSDLDIIRQKIDLENEGLDDDIKKVLYDRELLNKYKIDLSGEQDGISEQDIKIGEALLKRDASKQRTGLIESQKEFQFPDQSKVLEAKKVKEQASTERWNNMVDSNESVADILETSMIQIGKEDSPYNFEIPDPKSLVNMTKDQSQFFKGFLDSKGNVDIDKWLKVAAYASNPEGFENSLVEHGASTGKKEFVKKKKKISDSGSKSKTPQGGGKGGLLEAFRDRGVKS